MKKEHIKLTAAEERELKDLLLKGNMGARTSQRVLSLLELNNGSTYKSVAETVEVCERTLSRLVEKYNKVGLCCLDYKKPPGRPIKIDSKQIDQLTLLSCSEAPEGYAQWSLRLLADKMVELNYSDSISHTQVGKILKKRK